MNHPITATALLAALAWGAPVPAQAHDFTITVPVNVTGIPANVTDVSVTCTIMPEDYGDMTHQLGRGVKNATLTGGAFHGNVVVTVNVDPGLDPTRARWYQCTALFVGRDRGRDVLYFVNGLSSTLVFPLVAGAPVNLGNRDHWIRIPGVAH